jgi:hypothetical protein
LLVRSHPISPAGYKRIRLGMTKRQVEAAIGLPAGDYYTRHLRLGALSGPFVGRTLRESGLPLQGAADSRGGPGGEERQRVKLESWCGNIYRIRVAFDERGKAVSSSLDLLVHMRDSTLTRFLDQLQAWLGW